MPTFAAVYAIIILLHYYHYSFADATIIITPPTLFSFTPYAAAILLCRCLRIMPHFHPFISFIIRCHITIIISLLFCLIIIISFSSLRYRIMPCHLLSLFFSMTFRLLLLLRCHIIVCHLPPLIIITLIITFIVIIRHYATFFISTPFRHYLCFTLSLAIIFMSLPPIIVC